jgi:hypothetical protein
MRMKTWKRSKVMIAMKRKCKGLFRKARSMGMIKITMMKMKKMMRICKKMRKMMMMMMKIQR